MKINLTPIPDFGDTKTEIGFAWLPKIIVCGNKRTWIWLESYKIEWAYNAVMREWYAEAWSSL